MANEELLRRIDEHLARTNLSDRKASLRAQAGADFIRDLRRRGKRMPAADALVRLARAIGAAPEYLLEAVEKNVAPPEGPIALTSITVRGAVQAGVWRSALEWPEDERFNVTVPTDDRYPAGIPRFGLLVRGSSMDKLYPEGTIVVVIPLGDLGRTPNDGERVVVLRRDRKTGEYEATLKEFGKDQRGRILLWPRSSDPEFQSPIILGGQVPISFGDEPMPASAIAGNLHDAGEPDIMITALVVGSYRPE
ncbi:MAG: S24 family peptidase [Acetobacteraceae bacterium]